MERATVATVRPQVTQQTKRMAPAPDRMERRHLSRGLHPPPRCRLPLFSGCQRMVAPLCPHPGAFWPQVRDGPSGICLSNALESERMRAFMLVGKHRDDIRGHDMPHIARLMTRLGDSQHALGAKTLLPRLNMVAGQGVSRSQRTGRPHMRPAWDMHMVTPGGFEPSTPGLGNLCSIP